MRKTKTVIVLLCCLLLLTAGCAMLQKPISDNKGVVFHLTKVETQAAEGAWKEAGDSVKRLETAWNRDRGRLTSKRTQGNVKKFEASLEELKEEVRERDKEDVGEEISAMRNYYRNITSP